MTLRESNTVEDCCNKIVESIPTNSPTGRQSGSICSDQTQFGDRQDSLNSAPLQSELRAGTYIVPQSGPQFIYSCNGCIKSIQLAVSPTSQLIIKDAQGQERIIFHTFTEKNSIFQRREDVAEWNSSVVSTTADRTIVEYRPIGLSQLCFSQGDTFGFTIEAGSDVAILTRVLPDSDHLLLNTSHISETISGCPQLSDISLYTSTANFLSAPLIHIVTGKIYAVYSYIT